MSTALFIAVLALCTAVVFLYAYGERDLRRGRMRAVRRIRSVRRRAFRPLRRRLEQSAAVAWTRRPRRSVAAEIRGIALRVERASAAADRFGTAQEAVSRAVGRLRDLDPVAGQQASRAGPHRRREVVASGGWLAALALAIAGAATAAGNGWLLYRYVLPAVEPHAVLPSMPLAPFHLAVAVAIVPFVLGLAYYTLNVGGRPLGLRVLAVLVALLVAAVSAGEAVGVGAALVAGGVARPGGWGGVVLIALAAGGACLLPAAVAALSHSAIERLGRWIAARDRRAASRTMARYDERAGRLRSAVAEAADALETVRGEAIAIAREPAGRILLHPGGDPTVTRTAAVLRRLAAGVERDVAVPTPETAGAGAILGGYLGDLGTLAVWLLTSVAALQVTATGLAAAVRQGAGGAAMAAGLAAAATLLLGGQLLRLAYSVQERRAGVAARAAAVLLLGLGAASFAVVVGSLAAGTEGTFLAGRPGLGGAWLNLLILVAAVASIRIEPAITAAGSALTLLVVGAGWLLLVVGDVTLAIGDRLLAGSRGRIRASDGARSEAGSHATGALGGVGERR